MSDSLWPHESQHARPPCPSPTPGVHSDWRPSSQWCHPAISSSVIPFSSCPQSLPTSESFPMSQLFAWGGQSTGVSALSIILPKNTQGWSPSEWTGWISLQSKGFSKVFSNTTVQFFDLLVLVPKVVLGSFFYLHLLFYNLIRMTLNTIPNLITAICLSSPKFSLKFWTHVYLSPYLYPIHYQELVALPPIYILTSFTSTHNSSAELPSSPAEITAIANWLGHCYRTSSPPLPWSSSQLLLKNSNLIISPIGAETVNGFM